MSVIGWHEYDSYDRNDTSITTRWWRIGREGGSRIEVGERGFYLRLGMLEFTFRLRWRGEEDSP